MCTRTALALVLALLVALPATVQITQSAAVEPNQTAVLLIATSLREPPNNDSILNLHAVLSVYSINEDRTHICFPPTGGQTFPNLTCLSTSGKTPALNIVK